MSDTANSDNANWNDPKRLLWLMPHTLWIFPVSSWLIHAGGGHEVWLWLTPLFFYAAIPLIEMLFGTDESNPPREAIPGLRDDRYYAWTIYSGLPIVYAVWLGGGWYYMNGGHNVIGLIAITMTSGMVISGALNAGHEIGHRRDPLSLMITRFLLAISFMGHFRIEHNLGHHVHVATEGDSATSMMGESYYRFVLRELPGGYVRAWRIERNRLKRKGKRPFVLENELLQNWGLTLVLYGLATLWLGFAVLPYLLGAGLLANLHLSSANYVEHYGLIRQKRPSGKYERVQPHHSWNANHIVSNVLLYHLQRHSDHHAHAERPYQCLRHFDTSPQLPHGYFTMFVLAWTPPLWFRVMDPILAGQLDHDMTKAYIKPGYEERAFERYHRPDVAADAAPAE